MESSGQPAKGPQSPDEPVTPGSSRLDVPSVKKSQLQATPTRFDMKLTAKGVENAKKRLRAFSIQKKNPLSAGAAMVKPSGTNNATVLIGKLSGSKTIPKVEKNEDEPKKVKPPKPGSNKKYLQESYTELQKKTLAEIEDMKRKMELVDLGIPLGLICPASNEKAMPTKAMPPIKTFLDSAKVDEIIREAKKAKADGKEFKFDYQKFVPDYDNPFQRKREEPMLEKEKREPSEKNEDYDRKKRDKDRKKDRYEKRYDRKDRFKDNDRSKERKEEGRRDDNDSDKRNVEGKGEFEKTPEKEVKETDVNLKDYLVCDSWSLDTEDKNSSPKVEEKIKAANIPLPQENKNKGSVEHLKETCNKKEDSPKIKKNEKLQPVTDSIKFEIDPNDDDEVLDIFDEDSDLLKYTRVKTKTDSLYDSPIQMKFDFRDTSKDGMDDTFLESVINEIKQEAMSEDESQDKSLVEYDMSPLKENDKSRDSVTPELNEDIRNMQSDRSDYSDGRKSTESGYKSTESGYKSTESSYKSSRRSSEGSVLSEREVDIEYDTKISNTTVDSLETWSFVLKICQPLLFRHDKNKCYKETRVAPKLWYTENPKLCNCVKDRFVVYEELETCKMNLVNRLYGCDQISESVVPTCRLWYPRLNQCISEISEWETEDSQTMSTPTAVKARSQRRSMTPERNEEIFLDREYQRFMEAVWPEVVDPKPDTSRSNTPVKQDSRKKKKQTEDKEEEKKRAKKIKISTESWSVDSEMEEEMEKSKKQKAEKEKARKRKHSPSTLSSLSDSEEEVKKKKKSAKKKTNKKAKLKAAKRRRLGKKLLKKIKDKKKKRSLKPDDLSDIEEEKEPKKKDKKLKKKKQQKAKKRKEKKKKAKAKSSSSSDSSSSSTSSSDSESTDDKKKKKKKREDESRKKKKQKKKKRKLSSSDSQSDDIFDVNILNNIKTERLTDDERKMPEELKLHREIINVKELQEDFSSKVEIKQEMPAVERGEEEKTEEYALSESCDGGVANTHLKDPEPQHHPELPEIKPQTDESMSQSSQDSTSQEIHVYEKDVSHLRPPSQNSNYSFNEVISHQNYQKDDISHQSYQKDDAISLQSYQKDEDATSRHSYHKEDDNSRQSYQKEEDISHQSYSKDDDISQQSYQKEDAHQSYQKEDNAISHQSYHKEDDITHQGYQKSEHANSHHTYQKADLSHQSYQKEDDLSHQSYQKEDDVISHQNYQKEDDGYEHGNYEMYEQLAMAYQSDVASQQLSPPSSVCEQRIETVVRARGRGEIKCDWRAGDGPARIAPHRPSRWGLKPGEVNIVLTGGGEPHEHFSIHPVQPVYKIQSIANRSENVTNVYDEAYMDMYGASDRLQYGDCFSNSAGTGPEESCKTNSALTEVQRISSLDARIDEVLRVSVLGEVAKVEESTEKEVPEKGILLKCVPVCEVSRVVKRVSFADGYKPGQDSDVEEPPVKKKKRVGRVGCAWPCPATHPDHVPLWDALPPPPPPPGSPPPPPAPRAPPTHLLRQYKQAHLINTMPGPMHHSKFDPNSLANFMPPEPPPGLISFP